MIRARDEAIAEAIEVSLDASEFALEEAHDAREFVGVAKEVRHSIESRAARTIQTRARVFLARRRVVMIRYERDLATRARRAGLNLRASKIQCSWRQRVARLKVTSMRLKRLEAMEIAAARARAFAERQRRRLAATKIQSSIRVYVARKEVDLRRRFKRNVQLNDFTHHFRIWVRIWKSRRNRRMNM